MPSPHQGPVPPAARFGRPIGSPEGAAHFARQVEASRRLLPARAVRGRTALLLWCGEPTGLRAAERAIRSLWPLDEVHGLRCPIGSWAEALESPAGTASWLRRYVVREIHQHEPELLAVLDRRTEDGRGGSSAAAFVDLLRHWGASASIAVVRLGSDGAVQGLATPPSVLEETG